MADRRRWTGQQRFLTERIRRWWIGMGLAPVLGVAIAYYAIWSIAVDTGGVGVTRIMNWLALIFGVGTTFSAPIIGMIRIKQLENRRSALFDDARAGKKSAASRPASASVRERAGQFRKSRGISDNPDEALEDVKAGKRAVILRKRLRGAVFKNPVLKRELISSLRDERGFALQFIFLAVLSLVIYVAWPDWETRRAFTNRARMAFDLFRLFGQGELLLIAIMAPAFSAASMTVEKEKRTLDLLLTAPIPRHVVLIGKYITSLTFLALLIVSSIPIVATVQWLTGVGTVRIASMFVILLAIAMFVAMIGLTVSVHLDRSQSSIAVSYAITIPLAGALLILTYNDGFFGPVGAIAVSIVACVGLVMMYRVNYRRLKQPFSRVRKSAGQEEKRELDLVLSPDKFPDRVVIPSPSGDLLEDGVNPILFKENATLLGRGTNFLRWIILIMFLCSALAVTMIPIHEYIYAWVLMAFAVFLTPAFSCPAFTHEREYGTMEMLITTLLSPRTIIAGKWFSAFRVSWSLVMLPGVFLFVLYPLFGTNAGFTERLLSSVGYFAVITATVALLVTLSMAVSLFFETTLSAILSAYSFVLVVFILPALAARIIRVYLHASDRATLMIQLTSPFAAIYTMADRLRYAQDAGASPVWIITAFKTWPWYMIGCVVLTGLLLGIIRLSFRRLTARKL